MQLGDAFDLERFEHLRELDNRDELSGLDNFINLKLDGLELAFPEGSDITAWKPPAGGTLRFDYISQKKVPKEAKPEEDKEPGASQVEPDAQGVAGSDAKADKAEEGGGKESAAAESAAEPAATEPAKTEKVVAPDGTEEDWTVAPPGGEEAAAGEEAAQ